LIINRLFSIYIVNNNNNNIQRPGYEADGDNSDSNSLPSVNSDKDSQVKYLYRYIWKEISNK
jgi:hypothetical protein